MATCPSYKIDSNDTGLRVAVEECLKQLPSGPVQASGSIEVASNPVEDNTLSVAGNNFTFIESGNPTANQILIGANPSETAANIRAALVLGAAQVVATVNGSFVTLLAAAGGVAGNALALLTNNATALVLSGPTLTGGLDDAVVNWFPLEPNEYGDFGATITTVARAPINPSRQRKKGVVTDLEATAGYTSDMVGAEMDIMMEAFCFAETRRKAEASPTAVVAAGYSVANAAAAGFAVGNLIRGIGYAEPVNNRLSQVSAVTGAQITVLGGGLVAEPNPAAAAQVKKVGQQFAAGDITLTLVGGLFRLNATAGSFNALGLIAGEWIYIGGDEASTRFASGAGFARVDTVTDKQLTLGKVRWANPEADAGTGVTLRIFVGNVIRNENDPALIKRKSLQFERTMGRDADGTMSQYVIGAVANELTVNVPQADKITTEFAFVACDSVARSGLQGLKPGVREILVEDGRLAYNSSSDVRSLSFSLVGQPDPLFVYAQDFSLTINNNASGAKAIGVLGNMDINIGTYEVGGSTTAYFQDVRAINAVRDNSDVTCDLILVKANAGIAFDIPLLALGNGMAGVEADNPINVPLDTMAAQSSFGHTLLYVSFPYLPSLA